MAARREEENSASVDFRGVDPELGGIIDLESLNTDEYYYRFVQERPQRVARMRARGGSPVLASQDGVKTLIGDGGEADDKIRDGDCILMKFPRKIYDERRKRVATVTRKRLATPEANFRKKTKGAGPGGEDVNVVTKKEPK